MKEEWKGIEGYEGIYQVSNMGRVKRIDRYILDADNNRIIFKKGKMLKNTTRKGQGHFITLANPTKQMFVHRLVAQAFIDNPYNARLVRHKDKNILNNDYRNLYWYKRLTSKHTNTAEVWKSIEGYKGLYEVSNMGRVKACNKLVRTTRHKKIDEDVYPFRVFTNHKERILKQYTTSHGYKRVLLCKDTKQKWFYISSLVANAFISNPYNARQVRHRDGNPLNNDYKNLYWYKGDPIFKIDQQTKEVVRKYTNVFEAADNEYFHQLTIRKAIREKKPLNGYYYTKKRGEVFDKQ